MRHTSHPDERPGPRLQLPEEGKFWLLAACLLGVVGWWKSINLVLLLAYFMLVLLLVNARYSPGCRFDGSR